MPHQPKTTPAYHLDYLDTARGIAAIMVMAGHYVGWTHNGSLSVKLAAFAFNASDAVSFFFVLSGFVLSYKYITLGSSLDVRQYYINRLFRLWPAFFITVLINTLNTLYRSGIDVHSLTDAFIRNKYQFWEEALLIWSRPNQFGPGWTLVIELAASCFLPFIIALAKKDNRYLYWLLFALVLFGPAMINRYYFHFALGVVISCLYYKITAPSFKQTVWYRYRIPFIAAALLLFSIRNFERFSPLGSTYTYMADYFGISLFHYSAISAFIFIIVLLRSSRLQRMLRVKPLLFIGKIAYGIYLMHWLLVSDIFFYWNRIYPLFPTEQTAFVAVFFLYTAATILLASLLHYAIEKPFIRMGKRITARLKPSLVVE